ncbi:helix-turn-helix domain-containing protein [Glaciimonas sp. GS1]|uniref:Helix-turn-helix domain-containing protein n=2 Tax=Glaciimonas soli TaxID=2590999 RepID=A0A843YMD9_9BURK|nr:helix-turn-helix domain-containing protein [Glaciimonas soli]
MNVPSVLSGALINAPGRQLFASRELDLTRHLVGQVMKPHQLMISGRSQQLNSRMHHMAFGGVSFSRLKYGAEVDIQPEFLNDFYLIQMPLTGHAVINSGNQHVDSNSDVASVLSPTENTAMHWSADNDQLMIRIDRALVDRAIWSHLGYPENTPLRFQLSFRWRDCSAWQCLLLYLSECAGSDIDVIQYKLLIANIEQLVVSTLLSAQPHNFTNAKTVRRTTVLPKHVRKVEEFLREHVNEPICADQLAQLAGVSLRSLYSGFKEHCGVSPMHYLRNLRLDGARLALSTEPEASVACIAMQCGFSHLGRFSIEYKKRFGESPSESLRKR